MKKSNIKPRFLASHARLLEQILCSSCGGLAATEQPTWYYEQEQQQKQSTKTANKKNQKKQSTQTNKVVFLDYKTT